MNLIDKAVAFFAPMRGLSRAQARLHLEYLNKYETAERTRIRKLKKSSGDADRSVSDAGPTIREQARHLEENHDLVNGVLTTLVNNVIGPVGITVEPQPRDKSGAILVDFAEELESLYQDWSLHPEVTGEHDRAAMERLMARSLFRDGEFFAQHLMGNVPTLDHGTRVPYSLELLEADMVPFSYADAAKGIHSGVEKNAWGKPVAYWTYYEHPGSAQSYDARMKRVGAKRMIHGKLVNRIRQTRGVSVLSSVMTRLHNLKEYEESEQVAARISAAVAFQIKKGSPDLYTPHADGGEGEDRTFSIAPGIVFDNLRVGEEVTDVQSSRPSQLLQPFRDSMLRAVASGSGSGYSTISRNYDGTYSAQRQELVEQFVNYSSLTGLFIGQSCKPTRQRFITAAVASGLIRIPKSLDKNTLYDAEFRGPVMPWIDPTKEANANLTQVQAGFKSQSQVIRERGGNPHNTLAEIQRERAAAAEKGLSFSSTYSDPAAESVETDEETDDAKKEKPSAD